MHIACGRAVEGSRDQAKKMAGSNQVMGAINQDPQSKKKGIVTGVAAFFSVSG